MAEEVKNNALAASAAALIASHRMSDSVWDEYFPDLPKWQPELRTIFISLHHKALAGQPANITETIRDVVARFDVSENTARDYIETLCELNFISNTPSPKKRSETLLIPTRAAKEGLHKVGQDYLRCLQMVTRALAKQGVFGSSEDVIEADWLKKVREVMQLEVSDYQVSEN